MRDRITARWERARAHARRCRPRFQHSAVVAALNAPRSEFHSVRGIARSARASVPVAISSVRSKSSSLTFRREREGERKRTRGQEDGYGTKRRRVIRDNRDHVFGRHKSHYRDDGSCSVCARRCVIVFLSALFSPVALNARAGRNPDRTYTRSYVYRRVPLSSSSCFSFSLSCTRFLRSQKEAPSRDSSSSSGTVAIALSLLSFETRAASRVAKLHKGISFRRPGNYQPTKTRFLSTPTRDACRGKKERKYPRLLVLERVESFCFVVPQPLNRVASRIIIARSRDENSPPRTILIVRLHPV